MYAVSVPWLTFGGRSEGLLLMLTIISDYPEVTLQLGRAVRANFSQFSAETLDTD